MKWNMIKSRPMDEEERKEWIYDGYTKVHDDSRRHMVERWCYRCSDCGYIVRTSPKREAILSFTTCPNCGAYKREEKE